MDRTLWKTRNETLFCKRDNGCRVIVRKHRDHRLAAARIGNRSRLVGTERGKRSVSSRSAIKYAEVVSALQEGGRHPCAHVAQSDKSNLHAVVSVRVANWGRGGGAMNSGPIGLLIARFTIRSICIRFAESSDQPATLSAAST